MADYQAILDFWFSEPMNRYWFRSTPEIDAEIKQRFESLWDAGCAGALRAWEQTAKGALALVILLDQLPLNMYRDQAKGYQTEAKARAVADRAIQAGFDQVLLAVEKAFLYLPFMHSETLVDQERSVELFEKAGLDDNLRWARHHRDIVRRFGRFPHRNTALGRQSTPQELNWLQSKEAFKP